MPKQSHNFWNFSVKFYSSKDVAEACLELQEEFGLDINLLLFCLWFSKNHGELGDELLRDVWQFSYQWKKEGVQPLRSGRKWMKASSIAIRKEQREQFSQLREDIKTKELEAEKFQQIAIETLTKESSKPKLQRREEEKLVRINLLKLFHIHSIDQIAWESSNLDTVIEAFRQHSD